MPSRDITMRTSSGRRLAAFIATPDAPGEDPGDVGAGDADGPGAGPGRGPAVLVVHEALGLNDDMRRITRRFADAGYTALAPDLLGAGFKPLCIARFVQGVGKLGTGRPYRELAAFQDWLGTRETVDPERIGVVGFCMGGGFAMLYAARGGRDVRAVAPFYAALPVDDVIPDLCPTVASFGGRDLAYGRNGAPLRDALDAAGIPNEVKTYPDAGHSFMSPHTGLLARVGPVMPTRMGYDETAAEDAWRRMLTFFAEHLAPRDEGREGVEPAPA